MITISTKMTQIVTPAIKPLSSELLEFFPLSDFDAVVDDCDVVDGRLASEVGAEEIGAKVGLSPLTIRKEYRLFEVERKR